MPSLVDTDRLEDKLRNAFSTYMADVINVSKKNAENRLTLVKPVYGATTDAGTNPQALLFPDLGNKWAMWLVLGIIALMFLRLAR